MKNELIKIFKNLNDRIEMENAFRKKNGARLIPHSKIEILGQTSLLIQPELTYKLSLTQTNDLDAKLQGDHFVKKHLEELLLMYGFIYDNDSSLVFIPKGSHFLPFVTLSLIEVVVIDPESALVSKAVKAPEKNIQLLRQAIASNEYPKLVERIIQAGGSLKIFAGGDKI